MLHHAAGIKIKGGFIYDKEDADDGVHRDLCGDQLRGFQLSED